MPRTSLFFAAFAAGLLASTPAAGQDRSEAAMRGLSEEKLSRDLQTFLENPMQAPCTQGVAIATEVARRNGEGTNSGALLPLARTFCAYSRQAWDEAVEHYLEFETYNIPLNLLLGLQVATYADDHDEMVRQLRIVLFNADLPRGGQFAERIVQWSLSGLFEADRRDEVNRIAMDLALAGKLETLGDQMEQSFSLYALNSAITEAPDMVPDRKSVVYGKSVDLGGRRLF